MSRVSLLLFAAARESAGRSRDELDAATVGEALKVARERYGPAFDRVLGVCSVLRNGEQVGRDDAWSVAVEPGDEIAILPPVSGGAGAVSGGADAVSRDAGISMVDVGDKDETAREATAVCRLAGDPAVVARLLAGTVRKGDAVAAAKVAGILAAKRTPELIPLCHPVRTTSVEVSVAADGSDGVSIRATVRGRDRTGFEIEALVAASTAALTLYDFAKAEDPRMRVEALRIVAKSGGKSGSVTYP